MLPLETPWRQRFVMRCRWEAVAQAGLRERPREAGGWSDRRTFHGPLSGDGVLKLWWCSEWLGSAAMCLGVVR